MLRQILARARALWRREEIHGEIAEEREFHIAMRAADLTRGGMDPSAANEAARRGFGAALSMHEQGFDVRGGGVMEDIAADVRLALRMLRKTPVKTVALVATVALGIGINTAVFSVIKAVVLEPLPFAGAKDLVVVHQVEKGESEGVSYPNFEDWRSASRSFQGMAVYAPDSATLTERGQAQRVYGAVVSADLFRLLGVTPLRGRLFNETEDDPGSGRAVIVSDALWRTQLQGSEDVLGRSVILDGVGYRVIGVIPSALAFPVHSDAANYWVTVAVDAQPGAWGGSIRKSRSYPRYEAALGRLKPGVTVAQAQAEMNVIARNVARQHPGVDLKEGVRVSAAIEDVVGRVRPLMWTLYRAVFCVLAVSCANAATLLLVSAVARSREFALRAALGARPSRIVRQLLVESLVLALVGGASGALLAATLVALFTKIAPPDTPRLSLVHADGAMLLYAVALSVLTGLVFGVVPAAAAQRHDLMGTLKNSARALHPTIRRPSTLLIAGQIALSTMLGCSAVVLSGSFWRILHTPRGFDPHNVLTASVSLPPAGYRQGSEKVTRFYTDLLEQMRREPNVVAASVAQSLPLSGQNNSTQVEAIGAGTQERASADLRFVDPDYFRTLRIPLLEGRYPLASDRSGQPEIVVVNRAFAARFLRGRQPVGSLLHLGWGGDAPKLVSGVVGDVLHDALGVQATPEVYVPLAQFPINDMTLVVRTSGGPDDTARMLRAVVRRMDRSVPVENVRTLDDYLLLSVAPQRFLMYVLVAFAASTLLLAAIGLYGALSYVTVCRRHEFGVRMALGSNMWGVMRLVLRQGLGIAALGIAAGVLLMTAAARFLSGWLYRTSPFDAPSLTCACAVLMVVAAAACWGPALRATRVSPLTSLRG
jgi:putative ABC transport system permease protein